MKKGQIVVDLKGKIIDSLKVIQWKNAGHHGDTAWECLCACGAKCIKCYSYLVSKTKYKKSCGTCVSNISVIGKQFGKFKILSVISDQRKMDNLRFNGICVYCGYEKKISKLTINRSTRKRNLGCPNCAMMSRRGGGLKIGDTRAFLRIVGTAGSRGKGSKRQYFWIVKCLFAGPKCKGKMTYSTRTFNQNISCGCKRLQELIKVDGIAARNHPRHKIYTLYKHINDRCYKLNNDGYDAYGGRGIYVCDEWRREKGGKGRDNLLNFVEWCTSHGWQEGLQLDRIDNDGPYAPWNCQFIPLIENLFYSYIDNADKTSLVTYIQYCQIWEHAMKLIETNELLNAQAFKAMIARWKDRVIRRAKALHVKADHVS